MQWLHLLLLEHGSNIKCSIMNAYDKFNTHIGYGYANAGPTHYSNEDLGLANSIVNSNIYSIRW